MRTTFIFLIHFHQPVGQLKHVLDRVQANCYELLVRVLKKHPKVRVGLHFSGPLLMAWRKNYPRFLEDLRELVHNPNVETLGGTYAEAALPLLPREDRVEQLARGKKLVEELLGVSPKGAWLAERVWDPTLPPALEEAGYEYVVLDDEVGFRAGLGEDGVHRAWLTEYGGSRVGVLFIDARIRYLLPWRSHEEVLDYLSRFKGSAYVLWGSDAEKFGEWWDPVRAEEWLDGFLATIEQEDWIEAETPSRYIKKYGYAGLAYLPPGSYDKMMEWSGGYFPCFLRKYAESNNMHKKMLWVRRKLKASGSERALTEYLLAQCNDAYWHGLFGGIYLAFLRQAVYEHLIRAERLAEESLGTRFGVNVIEYDFDYDGEQEIILESSTVSAYVKPGDGGTLFELDIKIPGYEHNLVNTMSRYAEPYLEGVPGFRPDWYRRVCFREHIWHEWGSLSDWIDNTPFFDASDLALARYLYRVEGDSIVLFVTGKDWRDRARPGRVYVEKTFELQPQWPGLSVSYYWRNLESETREFRLCVELTLAPRLPYDGGNVGYEVEGVRRRIDETLASKDVRKIKVFSPRYPSVVIESDQPAEAWVAPLMSLARTEKGVREMFQALGLALNYRVKLGGGESFEHTVSIRLGEV